MASTPTDPSGPQEVLDNIRQVFETGITSNERDLRYDKFAEVYDSLLRQTKYHAPQKTAETVAEYIPISDRDKVQILDIGAGTGLVGEELRKLGFVNIVGLEPSHGMISKLQEKGVYTKCICSKISGEPLDIPEDTYDVITVTGSHGPNHIECDALYEMIRLVKPGGLVIIVTRMEHLVRGKDYKNRFFPLCDDLEKAGKWKKRDTGSFPNVMDGIEGVRIVYEVCPNIKH